MTRCLTIIGVIGVFGFALDQFSKYWVTEVLQLGFASAPFDVFPPYLRFRYAENCGINFGLFSNCSPESAWVLIALSVAICAGLLIWTLRRGSATIAIGSGLVLGGALANAWDRFDHGAVIDFLNNSCCGFDNPFSYNLADVWIFAGAIWIALRA